MQFISVEFNNNLYDNNDKILWEFLVFCAKYSIKYHAIFYILTYITDLNNIINDIIDEINNTEQLCHRPDGLLV